MHKKITAALLTAVLIFSCSGTVFAKEQTIKIDGLIQTFSEEPIVKEEQTLVSIDEICKLLGVSVERDKKARTITAHNSDTVMVITEGKKEVYVNDKEKFFSVIPVSKNGMLMVPVKFMCETFGAKYSYNEKINVITVSTGRKALQILKSSKAVSEDTKVFEYKDALSKVISANSQLKNLEESVDLFEEKRVDAIDNYYDTIMNPSATIPLFASADVTTLAITLARTTTMLQNQLLMVPIREQITKDTSEYMLRSTLSNIASYEMDIKMLEENMKQQNRNIKNLDLKLSLGMASENELKTAKQDYEQSKSSLNLLDIYLTKEKNSLKKLMDYNDPKDISVIYEPVIKPINVNIKTYVSSRVSEDPTVKMKKIAVEEAKYKLDTTTEDMDESKLELENNYNTAARDLYDTERNLEAAIRAAYNDILSLEERQKSLDIDLQKAKDDYNSMVANYEVGLVTMYEVDALKLAILKVEIEQSKNAYSYWNLTYAFEKPYLLPN